MIDLENILEGEKSRDVFRGFYTSITDPVLDLTKTVLPGKGWLQVDAGGNFIAAFIREATNNFWIPISVGVVRTIILTTPEIDDQVSVNLAVNLAKSFHLLKLEVNYSARVRLYSTAAYRANDAGRARHILPVAPHGVICDAVLTANSLIDDSMPKPFGANQESVRSAAIPIAVQNLSGFKRAIEIKFTFLVLEN